MYRVMVVEDEPPIMRLLKSTIEESDSELKVVSCCMNGKDAISKLQTENYDIVFTDIKMPIKDGLELSEWIHENKPETIVVILSGYKDFEYARRALGCKVFEYALKPVSKKNIKEIIARIKNELKKQTKSDNSERDTVIVLACAGAYLLYGSDALLPSEKFWGDDTFQNLIKKILNENEDYIFFNTNLQSERFIVIEAEGIERQQEIVLQLYNNINYKDLPVTVIYKKGVKFKDAGANFGVMREQLVKQLILGKAQIIDCDENDFYENIMINYNKDDIMSVASAIKKGDENIIKKNFSKIVFSMKDAQSTQEDMIGLLNIILDTYILDYKNKINRSNASVKKEFIIATAGFTSYESFIDDIVSIFMSLRIEDKNDNLDVADRIEIYLIENYSKNITNETLSEKFGFVPSYISRIFKKKKGISPSEYLIKYRIDLAKKILSEEPDIKIKEVAYMVGFKEAYYFSKTFKRETGMWPTEYGR